MVPRQCPVIAAVPRQCPVSAPLVPRQCPVNALSLPGGNVALAVPSWAQAAHLGQYVTDSGSVELLAALGQAVASRGLTTSLE